MRLSAACAAFVTILVLTCTAQNKAKPQNEAYVRGCAPRLKSTKINNGALHGSGSEIHFRNGEKYTKTPVIAYQVLESGDVVHAIVKRSSGVADVDRHALRSIKDLKFNKRQGCPVVDSEAAVTVDFR